jgi:hypothetical protein
MNVAVSELDAAESRAARGSGPPRLPFVLSVGITGHRTHAIPEGGMPILRARIREVLELIGKGGVNLYSAATECFAKDPPRMCFVSPLADGADQIAADIALELGWELQVVLPFERDFYRGTLGDDQSRETFDGLLKRANRVLELPGEAANQPEGYAMAGRATVAHCDLLIAVWDGHKARGRGGTGEVVELAVARGTPLAHIPPEPDRPARLLWAAFDPVVDTLGDDPMSERPLDAQHIDQILSALFIPPPDEQEKEFLARFFKERLPRFRPRVEYRLLLAAAGVRRLRLSDFREKESAQWIREEWQQYREKCVAAHNVSTQIELLEDAYSWTDRLATNLAQTYRSGHIFAFTLGGLAVCMGLGAFMFPHLKFQEAFLEMMITVAIILNAHIGSKREWHRRWLDYRQLAERLRPMRSLKVLGIAAPDPPGTDTNPVPRRWIEWYAAGIWRAMGCPAGSIDRPTAGRLAEAVGDHEVAPQVSYHRHNARQIQLLDERLEQVGTWLFFATLIVSNTTLIGIAIHANYINTYGNWFTLVSAGFPALATAVFGIRFQGDFGGDALRSLATADTLAQIDRELRKDTSLSRAADLTEQAARFMLADLDEWRLVNQQRDLSVG